MAQVVNLNLRGLATLQLYVCQFIFISTLSLFSQYAPILWLEKRS